MKRSSFFSIFIVVALATGLAVGGQALRPQPAQAIPMFAKRTGASCELCHTVFPGMTNYGMMVMMSNFSMLPYHSSQDTGLTSFVVAGTYVSNPDDEPQPPKLFLDNLGLLSGGFFGPHFTYYLEQHIVDGGFIGGTDQLWLSYNELFGASGGLQAGKFHTPFPFMPAHRITIAPYATTSFTIGGNDFNEDDSHWGATISQMQGPLMYSASVLGNNDLIGPGAFQLFGDTNHGLDFQIMTMSENPLNAGLGLISGYAPPAQAGAGFDKFDRSALYLQYIPSGLTRLQFQALGQLESDSDPFGTGVATHNHGAFVEAQYNLTHGNWGVLRWDNQSGPSSVTGFTLDFIHQFTLNTKLTIEGRSLVSGPQFNMSVEWAGPWSRHNMLEQPVLGSMPGMNMGAMSMSNNAMSALNVTLSRGDAVTGQTQFVGHNCAACHGVGGAGGGIGPKLIGIANSLQPSQIYDYIKHPRVPMPNFNLNDADIADLVAYVVSLTPGHTVAADVAKTNSGMSGMSMPGMSMKGMSMAQPPPVYPSTEKPLEDGDHGYFAGVETGDALVGGTLFGASCTQCHGARAQGATAQPLDTLAMRFTPSYIAWRIHDHEPTLPKLQLTDKQIADLTAFLETITAGQTKSTITLSGEGKR